jgi:TonB-linked SusC/RagA family outer membrane protein
MKNVVACHIILLLCLSVGFNTTLIGQNQLRKQVTIVADQWEVSKVVEQLQLQTGIPFFFSVNAIGADRKITCRYFKVPLQKFLDEVLKPLQVYYRFVDNQIILYTQQKTAFSDKPLAVMQRDSLQSGENYPVKTPYLNTIRGKVTNEKGVALAGASVVLEGTKIGSVTNKNGQFVLEINKDSGRVMISYTAYLEQRVNFSSPDKLLEIKLLPLVAAMEEVVVIGYGTQQRTEMTSASVTVRGSTISNAPVGTFDAALQGRAAGVMVSQQGGSPGSPVRIQVRGTSSVSSGTEPLYIVDGIFVFQELNGISDGNTATSVNPLVTINPDDISTIEILKDAAATAIYGARGANGVIIITTKQGKRGQGNLSVTLNRGISNANNTVDYVTGAQWLAMVDKARSNTVGFGIAEGQEKFNPLTLVSNNLPAPSGITGNQFGPNTAFTRDIAEKTNTNWLNQMLRQGTVTDVKLSAGNDFENGNFYLSGQYWDEQGILQNQRLQRYTFRANFHYSPNKKWRFGSKLSPTIVNNQFAQISVGGNGESLGRGNRGATGGWQQANSGSLPIMPVYHDDGTYFDPLRGRNVVSGSDPNNFNSNQRQFRFLGNLYAEFNPISSLKIRAETGADFINSLNNYWISDIIRYNRLGGETGAFINNYSGTAYGTYQPLINDDHSFSLTGGLEWQKSTYRRQSYLFEGLMGNQQDIGEISSGDQFLSAVSGIFPDHIFTSLFVRANYQYQKRYLLAMSFRRDGSSVFSPNNRFGSFPSLSAGWIISDEPDFKKSRLAQTFSFLKLRGSFGITGNAAIPAFAYQSNFVNWPIYGQSTALALSVIGNSDIRWETNKQMDGAVEFGLFNNRIRGSFGAFTRTSRDMLLSVPVAPTVGIGAGSQSVIVNIGNLQNSGIEWELSALVKDNQKQKNRLKWTVDLNASFLQNKVVKLTDFLKGLPSGNFSTAVGILQGVGITQINGNLGAYYLAEYAGLDSEGFETIYEIDRNILISTGRTVKTGNILRATQSNINNNRMVQYGKTGLPTWFGGINQTFNWKGFELSALLTFQGGNYIYDGHEEATNYVRTGTNVIRAAVLGNNWSPDNPGGNYPKLTWNMRDNKRDANGDPSPQSMGTRTTRYLYKGDYARLKTVSLSYPVPQRWISLLKLQSARFYVSGQNLLTFTQFPGFDPEILVTGPGTQGRNLSQGFLSSAPVPQVRTFMMGFNIVL